MRIDGNKPLNGVQRGRERRGANGAGGSFSVADPTAAAQSASPHGMASISGIDALLALQSVGEAGGRGARLRHGHAMLDLLDDIRLDMLSGGLSPSKLSRLVDMVAQRPARDDEDGMETLLDEIELRARVELAKLGQEAA